MEIKSAGGKREGAGRKKGKTFKEPTGLISVRVPESMLIDLKKRFGKQLPDKIRTFLNGLIQE